MKTEFKKGLGMLAFLAIVLITTENWDRVPGFIQVIIWLVLVVIISFLAWAIFESLKTPLTKEELEDDTL